MEYAYINVPAAPVRRKPDHRKEMVNQLLFGETVKVLKQKGDLWIKVQGLHDGYEGWVTSTLLKETEKAPVTAKNPFVVTELLGSVSFGENKIHVPVGSSLPMFDNGKGKLGKDEYVFSGYYRNANEQKPDAGLVNKLTRAWLNAPYLWGGRTPLGVDCSGFVQVIFKLMGYSLPRDAWQQAQVGRVVKKLESALPGDLAFFDNKEDIVHVGILLGGDSIIHASGKVRIDGITEKGIINAETGKRTLRLRAVRRILDKA